MIVTNSPFILSAAASGQPLSLPRICWQTWLRELEAAAVTASDTAEGPKDAPLRPDTATYWRPPALPATYVADFGATRLVDYVGLGGHSIGSCHAAVRVETSIDDGVWTVVGQDAGPADDAPLLFLDTKRQARKLRVTLTGVGEVPRIASIYAGEALVMPRAPEPGFRPINLNRETVLKGTLSRGGQFLGQDVRRLGMRTDVSFAMLDADWYRETFDRFVAAARRYPYFFAWQPEAYPKEVGYVWTVEDFAPSHSSFDLMSVAWSMRGIGHE